MDSFRYMKNIDSDSILLDGLDEYKGKNIGIIITILPDEILEFQGNKSLRGVLKKYANTKLIPKEKKAWKLAVKEEYSEFSY